MSIGCSCRFRGIRGTFGHIALGAPRRHGTHVHEQISVTFCISGKVTMMLSTEEMVELSEGSVMVIDSYEPHATLTYHDGTTEVFTLLLDTNWVEENISIGNGENENISPNHAVVGQELQSDVQVILGAIVADDGEMLRDIEELVARVVAETFRLVKFSRPDDIRTRSSILDYRVRKALRYIDDTIADRVQLGDIARHVGLSRSHFFEQFRRSVGVPPSAYANWQRTLLALEYLTYDSSTLAELSDLLGFSGPPQFSRFFTQQIGVSPSQFRLNVRSLDRSVPMAKPVTTQLASRRRSHSAASTH